MKNLIGLFLVCMALVMMAPGSCPINNRTEDNPDLCSDGTDNDGDDLADCDDSDCLPFCHLLNRATRNSPVWITTDDTRVVMVNTDSDSVSTFDTASNTIISEINLDGNEPTSVMIHPDNTRAYIANRGDGTIREITGIDLVSPQLGRVINVCAEPYGLALSPRGIKLYVTCAVDNAFAVVDTESMDVIDFVPVDMGGLSRQVRAISVTNDGDFDDDDEMIHIAQFFSEPSGIVNPSFSPFDQGEGTDFGQKAVIHVYKASDLSRVDTVDLAHIDDTGFPDPANSGLPVGAYPNQLRGIVLHEGFGYVVSTAASPRGDVKFNANLFALVSVYDLNELTEVRGEPDHFGTVELNGLVKLQAEPQSFLNVPFAIDFATERVGYIVASGSDIVLRANWRNDGTFDIGSNVNDHIPVGERPVGIVVNSDGTRGYVANEISRDLSVIQFSAQAEIARIASTAKPVEGTDAFNIWKGKRFFTTGTSRWSSESWSSCEGCHPDGITDNVTFHFAAGPRNVPGLNGSFAPNDPTHQRVFNWTGIFNEVHDFELNTRGVSGGIGAIVFSTDLVTSSQVNLAAVPGGPDCDNFQATENHANNLGSSKEAQDKCSVLKSFDQINRWVQTVRSPIQPSSLNATQIARGRQVFTENNCQNCHGGPLWTISRLYYQPSLTTSTALLSAPLDKSGIPANVAPNDTLQLANEAEAGGPQRITCVLRRVGTFGNPDPDIEVRKDMRSLAQGQSGFNVPSLLGVGQTEPYFHHGGAQTLQDLFTPQFAAHHQAASPNFLEDVETDPDQQAQRDDLIAFLRSIDDSTQSVPIPPDVDICPETFPEN